MILCSHSMNMCSSQLTSISELGLIDRVEVADVFVLCLCYRCINNSSDSGSLKYYGAQEQWMKSSERNKPYMEWIVLRCFMSTTETICVFSLNSISIAFIQLCFFATISNLRALTDMFRRRTHVHHWHCTTEWMGWVGHFKHSSWGFEWFFFEIHIKRHKSETNESSRWIEPNPMEFRPDRSMGHFMPNIVQITIRKSLTIIGAHDWAKKSTSKRHESWTNMK